MSNLVRKTVCYAKVESTPGTDSTPTASEAIFLVGTPKMVMKQEPNINEELHAGFNRKVPGAATGQHWEIELTVYLRGSGTNTASVTDAPSWDPLIKSAGWALSSGTYTRDSDSTTTCTVYLFQDGKKKIATGCRFKMNWATEANGKVMLKFTGFGIYSEPTDASPSTVTDGEAVPVIAKNAACSWGPLSSSEMKLTKFEFDDQGQVEIDPNLNAATGINGFFIADQDPICKIDPEMTTTAVANLFSYAAGGTTGSFTITLGSATDNTFTIAGTAYLPEVPEGERAGRWIHDLQLNFVSNTADGECSIAMS